jgi:ubiquitin C-terminal hydrolase
MAYVPPAIDASLAADETRAARMARAVKLAVEAEWRGLRAESSLEINITAILQILSELNPDFRVGKQQDSAEAMVRIIDLLNEAVPGMRAVFAATLRSNRTCAVCNGSRVKDETVLSLSLPVANDAELGIDEALLNYLATERFDDRECDGGTCVAGQLYPAVEERSLPVLPSVLMLTLNRFVYVMENEYEEEEEEEFVPYVHRLDTSVVYPLELDMSAFPGGAGKYRLAGVVHHEGISADEGHYIADFLHPDDGTFYNADDELVAPIIDQPELETESSYILFYERI